MPRKKKVDKASLSGAVIAWLFAPFSSLFFLSSKDKFTRRCAKHALYLGVSMVIINIIMLFINMSLFLVGTFLALFWMGAVCFSILVICLILWIGLNIMWIVGNVIGAVKANKGELFEVPIISGMVKA